MRALNNDERTVVRSMRFWVASTICALAIVAWSAGARAQQPCGSPDRDGDCVGDSVDACPDVAGSMSNRGCPVTKDADADGDGISDRNDQCPSDPEDIDGFEDGDGCPDPDNDRDGILDAADKCPNQAETFNGYEDADGCPDRGTSVVVPPKDSKDPPKPAAAVAKPTVNPAVATAVAPSGYRCGPGGSVVLNHGCKCAPGRTERRDGDDVAVCAIGAALTPRTPSPQHAASAKPVAPAPPQADPPQAPQADPPTPAPDLVRRPFPQRPGIKRPRRGR